MEKILRSVVGAVVLFSTAVFAGEPAHELDPKTAVKLICLRSNLIEQRVEIAYIDEGALKGGDGFEYRNVRRVAAIHPMPERGSLVRRVVIYDFKWNDSLGWYLREVRTEKGGDAVYCWSENGGATVVR